jgi:hypothetical protein
MEIPFDTNSGEKYLLEICENEIDSGDGIVLSLNRKACIAYANIFQSLADQEDGHHIHLGYDHDTPEGPGFRVVLNEDI